MTREEAIYKLKQMKRYSKYLSDDEIAAIVISIEALEHPEKNVIAVIPCGDAISRQAAIDALTKTSGIRGDALKALYALPSVTPLEEELFREKEQAYYCGYEDGRKLEWTAVTESEDKE